MKPVVNRSSRAEAGMRGTVPSPPISERERLATRHSQGHHRILLKSSVDLDDEVTNGPVNGDDDVYYTLILPLGSAPLPH